MEYHYICKSIDLDEYWDDENFESKFSDFMADSINDFWDDSDPDEASCSCPYVAYDIYEQTISNVKEQYGKEMISVFEGSGNHEILKCNIKLSEMINSCLRNQLDYPYQVFAAYQKNGRALEMYIEEGEWTAGLYHGYEFITDPEEWPKPEKSEHGYIWKIGKTEYTPAIWFGPESYDDIQDDWMITDDNLFLPISCGSSHLEVAFSDVTSDDLMLMANMDNGDYRYFDLDEAMEKCPLEFLRKGTLDSAEFKERDTGTVVSDYLLSIMVEEEALS